MDVSGTLWFPWRRWTFSVMIQNGHWLPNPLPPSKSQVEKPFSNHSTSHRKTEKCQKISSRKRSQCNVRLWSFCRSFCGKNKQNFSRNPTDEESLLCTFQTVVNWLNISKTWPKSPETRRHYLIHQLWVSQEGTEEKEK